MVKPLSAADVGVLQSVLGLLSKGQVAEAAGTIVTVSAHAISHPDALYVAAQILVAQGRFDDAQRTLEGAIALAPDNPHLWNSLGNLFDKTDQHEPAEQAFTRATQLAPAKSDFWLNLATAQIDLRNFAAARQSLDRVASLGVQNKRSFELLGLCAQGEGAHDKAAGFFRSALADAPDNLGIRHNLATALRASGDPAAALDILGGVKADLPLLAANLRGHLLTELGQFEAAVGQYQAVLTQEPGLIDAHMALSRLLPQVGKADEALDAYRSALDAQPQNRALWDSAIAAAKEFKASGQLIAWCDQARMRFGDDMFLLLARAIGANLGGDRAAAISQLRQLAEQFPDEAAIRNHLVPSLVGAGALDEAEHHASHAVRLTPLDQSGWAWLTILWRLSGDPREEWLADYDQLVMPIDLAMDSQTLARLKDNLTARHIAKAQPAEQSLRGGTQTQGNLFDAKDSEIRDLAQLIKVSIEQRLAGLKPDRRHPFLGRLSQSISFAGSWSVRLASAGFHVNHIHHMGWLSSALYIDLPPEVAQPNQSGSASPPGALAFGVPDALVGLDLAPRRVVGPKAGQLVVFPSYFWHGTVPFESQSARLTVAFDALPHGERRA